MDVRVSKAADAAYVKFSKKAPAKGQSREVAPGVIMDFDDAGDAVGVEVLGLQRRGLTLGEVHVDVDTEPGEALPDNDPLVERLRMGGALESGPAAATG